MKAHSEKMKEVRKECIKILDNNPNCTSRDFRHLRPWLNNNDITVRPLTTNEIYVSQPMRSVDKLIQVYSCVDENGIIRVGSIPDLAYQLDVSYNLLYNTSRGISAKNKLKVNLIDYVPLVYTCSEIYVYEHGQSLFDMLDSMEKMTYGEACVKYNIHTSDLWELIDNDQTYQNRQFMLGDRYVWL